MAANLEMERIERIARHIAPRTLRNAPNQSCLKRENTGAAAAKDRTKDEEIKQMKTTRESPLISGDLADIQEFPLPMELDFSDSETVFPEFPMMRRKWEEAGMPPLFTFVIAGSRRMTVIADRELFRLIFFPDQKHISSNQSAIAHQWFGVEREFARKYTLMGLKATRKALKQSKARGMNDIVGKGILKQFDELFPLEGTTDLFNFAWLTFWPVNVAMFGQDTINQVTCPGIRDDLVTYNHSFELVSNGMPRKMFPSMEEAAQRISHHFGEKIKSGNAASESCPVLKARDDIIEDADKQNLAWDQRGRNMLPVFWAAQANTIPGTFWALALVLSHPDVKARVLEEARSPEFAGQPNAEGKFDLKPFKYVKAVIREVLRLKVANVSHRKAQKPFAVKATDGKTYRIPEGDTLTVLSHINHYDKTVFEDPQSFKPERWLDGRKYPQNAWFPFGGGPYTCSGKFLAEQEITTLLLLSFREFDLELGGNLPEENWKNVVAMVTPKETVNVKFRRHR